MVVTDVVVSMLLMIVHCCRPNLYLSVSMKHPDVMKDLRSQMVRKGDELEFDGPTIIYCPTKKSAESLTNAVKGELLTQYIYSLQHTGIPYWGPGLLSSLEALGR